MTGSYIDYALFGSTCLTLLIAPFIPAFREWRFPTDVSALPVAANYSSDIDHFASRLQRDVAARMGFGNPTGYEDFQFVSDGSEDMDWGKVKKRAICRSAIHSKNAIHCKHPLYVNGHICSGVNSEFSALYATGDIELGTESEVHDWAHADGTLHMKNNSIALRRISAGNAIKLGNEVGFERLQAPLITFGFNDHNSTLQPSETKEEIERVTGNFAELPNAVQQTPELFLVKGDCTLPAQHIYRGSLIVTGFLSISDSTCVVGDIKARQGFRLGNHATVEGAITCETGVHLLEHCRVHGPLISEKDLIIGAYTVVGLAHAQTTVSARNIIVQQGAIVHGSVWAHEIGMVKAS